MSTSCSSPVIISIYDYVKVGSRVCYVENITSDLGYRQYHLIDIDSGVQMKKSRYQIEPYNFDLLSILKKEDMEFEEKEPITEEKLQESNEDKEKRFKTMTEEELNEYALNRNSKRTKQQTTWAVAIFKGKYQNKDKSAQKIIKNAKRT